MSVGSTLAEARARAGMTLDQVAEETRIRRTLVENIEADDFHACGGDFYARGHIRSIAHVLGIDAEPLVREFDGEHPAEEAAPTATGVLLADGKDDTTRRRPNWSAAMAGALAVVLGFGAWSLVGSGGSEPDRPPAVAGGTSDAGDDEPAPQTSPDAGTVPSDDAVAQAPDVAAEGVVVVLSTDDGRSWVSATGRGGKVLYEGLLEANQEKTVRDASRVSLVAGNAGALSLNVNGEDVGSPGSEGEVVRLTFGPGAPDTSGG